MTTIAALRNGDAQVFQEVFLEYSRKLYYYILSKTKSPYLAEECVQLSFLRLWQFRENLNDQLTISCQLFRIARTTLIDILRKEKNCRTVVQQFSAQTSTRFSNQIEDWVLEQDLRQRVSEEVWRMPPVRRKVFEMSRVAGMSYKEIAEELVLSVKTVEHHISKAIKQLQHILPFFLAVGFFL